MIKLTERLQKIYDQVRPGESVCDVGTDHGYVPLALLESGRSPKAIMSDISAGSLAKCKVNAEAMLPSLAPFDLRQGSGIEVLESGEVDTVIMAGMGGMLISEILEKDYHHSHSFKRYILQPRKHVGRLRYWLLDNDFTVVHEDLAREGKFIWPILTVESFGRALFVNADTEAAEGVQDDTQVADSGIFYAEFRTGDSRHADERTDLNHIWQQFMLRAVEGFDSFDGQEV